MQSTVAKGDVPGASCKDSKTFSVGGHLSSIQTEGSYSTKDLKVGLRTMGILM